VKAKVTRLPAADRDLAHLKERFLSAHESYATLRDSCKSSVGHWQWASDLVCELDPLFFLDHGIAVGQISKAPPANPLRWVAYGFSGEGRLVEERRYTELPGRYYHGFYEYLQDRIIGQLFDHSPARHVINCSQLIFDASGPAYFQRWGTRGWVSYTYACTNRRVDAYVGVAKEHDDSERHFSGQLLYKENGILERWEREQDNRPVAIFRGRPPAADDPFVRVFSAAET